MPGLSTARALRSLDIVDVVSSRHGAGRGGGFGSGVLKPSIRPYARCHYDGLGWLRVGRQGGVSACAEGSTYKSQSFFNQLAVGQCASLMPLASKASTQATSAKCSVWLYAGQFG